MMELLQQRRAMDDPRGVGQPKSWLPFQFFHVTSLMPALRGLDRGG